MNATEILAPLSSLTVPQLRTVYRAAASMLKVPAASAHLYFPEVGEAHGALEMTGRLVWIAASQCRKVEKTGRKVWYQAHTSGGTSRYVDETRMVETHEEIVARLVSAL